MASPEKDTFRGTRRSCQGGADQGGRADRPSWGQEVSRSVHLCRSDTRCRLMLSGHARRRKQRGSTASDAAVLVGLLNQQCVCT